MKFYVNLLRDLYGDEVTLVTNDTNLATKAAIEELQALSGEEAQLQLSENKSSSSQFNQSRREYHTPHNKASPISFCNTSHPSSLPETKASDSSSLPRFQERSFNTSTPFTPYLEGKVATPSTPFIQGKRATSSTPFIEGKSANLSTPSSPLLQGKGRLRPIAARTTSQVQNQSLPSQHLPPQNLPSQHLPSQNLPQLGEPFKLLLFFNI